MADIRINADIQTQLWGIAGRGGIFWTTPLIGYIITATGTDNLLIYQKTVDGGATWGAEQSIRAVKVIAFDSYADWQTVGDAGTKIHIVYFDATNDQIRYVNLDTSDDSINGDDLIEAVQGSGAFDELINHSKKMASITKTRGGNFAVAFMYNDDAAAQHYGFYTSPDAITWTSKNAVFEAASDRALLFPGNEADNQDVWCLYWDQSFSSITLKVYDDSAGTWGETLVVNLMTPTSNYLQCDGTIRHSDGHLIVAAWSQYDDPAADLRCWDIDGAGSIVEKDPILTDSAESFLVSVFVDPLTDDIYVCYCKGTAAGINVAAFYKKSTDDAASWGLQTAMQADGEDDMKWISAGTMNAAWGGKFQPHWFNDDWNDLFTNKDNGISIVSVAPPDPPTNVAATENQSDKVVITWTKSDGATKYEVFRDGVGLGELGDVATYDDTGADAPTITPGTGVATDGLTAYVTLSLSGQSTSNGTTHTYTVKAWNEDGWSDASGSDTGYREVGSLTYQWQKSSGDSDADYSNIDSATTEPYNHTVAHIDGRYYKCVENATGASEQTSSADRGWRKPLEVAGGDLIGIGIIRKS